MVRPRGLGFRFARLYPPVYGITFISRGYIFATQGHICMAWLPQGAILVAQKPHIKSSMYETKILILANPVLAGD